MKDETTLLLYRSMCSRNKIGLESHSRWHVVAYPNQISIAFDRLVAGPKLLEMGQSMGGGGGGGEHRKYPHLN